MDVYVCINCIIVTIVHTELTICLTLNIHCIQRDYQSPYKTLQQNIGCCTTINTIHLNMYAVILVCIRVKWLYSDMLYIVYEHDQVAISFASNQICLHYSYKYKI